MAPAPVVVRPATADDAPAIARLSAELGYPVGESTIARRVGHLLASPSDLLLVAASDEGAVIGWIHGFLSQLIESEYRVEIGGLIVGALYQRRGVGRRLVEAVGQWAREHGAAELSVRCQTKREEAHRFYAGLGFGLAKTQHVFRRPVEPLPPVRC